MRAAWFDRHGPAREVLAVGEMPVPAPGPGEVRVRVHASGINPSDVKRRLGTREQKPYPRVIPHSDGAGVVDAVGAGVTTYRPGERVWIHGAQRGRAFGTAAEYAALPLELLIALPPNTSFAHGAALGVPGLTAHRAVMADGPVEGQDILVTGGAGAVGLYAVQVAKLGGARVLTTVSSPEKAAQARAAGADVVIDYKKEDVVKRVQEATDGRGLDRVVEVDFGANIDLLAPVLKPNAVVAAYASEAVREPTLPFYALMAKNITLRLIFMMHMPRADRRAGVEALTRWAGQGVLKHPPIHTLPLASIAEAHELVEQHVHGKVILEI
ncbi:MAG: NADPH:quinone reductase [Candidatus Rokubacteria bacterium]|nr:NADPH:quinone reductase [Candidatus Rokubacteria bacterium]